MLSKLDQVRTFKTVAECGSLIDAAKILNRTPSAISMSLKQFTQQLGGELFETDRKSILTPLGDFVLEQSRTALNDFDESMESIERYAEGDFGTVRIACVPSFSTRMLPKIVKQFSLKMPDVRLELRDIDSDLINKAVSKGIIDLGIASRLGKDHQLKTKLLFEEPLGVVCQPNHLLAKQVKPVSWAQLKTQEFVSSELHKLLNNSHIDQLRKKAKLHIHNLASLLTFIIEGFGVTLLPRSAIPDHLGLCFLPLEDASAQRQLFLIEHKKHKLSPAVKSFKAQIKNSIKAGIR